MEVLRVHNVTKVYGTGHTAVRALDGVHLHVEEGEIVLIMGPSGSGKTTLLTVAGGLLKPTTGEVIINGQDITKLSERQLPAIRLKSLGFVFQSFNLLAALTAEQNAAIPLMIAGHSPASAGEKARQLLVRLGLQQRLQATPHQLSGGEQQRVAIARAFVTNPKIILADEPTANLDSKIGHEVMRILCETACQDKRAVVIVSHDGRLRDIAHRVLTIEDGKLTREESGGHNQTCRMPHGEK
ncbi:MAG: ABC transporter ATP-binding protein [Candidatus Kerfeldbacteria bacterium]|nr:ABC transporter ATP-binding protein [Candidatus Kerfeldbacteria bacterium]